MEQESVDVVIVRLEIVYAGARLEAEDVNVVVFARERKRFLTRQLASYRDAAIADEK